MNRHRKFISMTLLACMVFGLALYLAPGSISAATPSAPAPNYPVFKLLAERTLGAGEDPQAAVAAATSALMSYIDKNGAGYKILPNGNSPDGRSLKMPSPAPGVNIRIVEIYNPAVDGCIMQNEGGKFNVALPWEYSIYTDGSGKIYVNMLVPKTVFSLMGQDHSSSEALSKTIEDSMTKFVTNSLGQGWNFPKTYMQPVLAQAEIDMARQMIYAPQTEIAVPAGKDPEQFANEVRDSVINSINSHSLIEPTKWHVARYVDYTGGTVSNTYSLELCSPYYATMALSMGAHHSPALPCQVGVWLEDGVVKVNILDPNFIFAWYFKDAVGSMTPEQLEMFAQLPVQVMSEIKSMVNDGIAPYTSNLF